ncbi:MAG TPA: MFS transporter [Nocardioides sp.]|nr:MFS transporter [Nocardioides sp.]
MSGGTATTTTSRTRDRLPLRGWLLAEAVSLTGTRVSMVAIPWFVLTTTGSATLTGLVAFAEMAPLVALKALAGPLVDRVGARRVAIGADLGSFVAVGLVPALHLAGLLSFPVLLGLVAVAGALRGPGDGAKHAMIPALVEHADVPTERATGLSSAIERTASMAGAALAGVLIALLGPTTALALDAASFLLSAAILVTTTGALRRPAVTPAQDEAGEPEPPYLHRLREGWQFLRRDPLLLGLSLMVAVTNLFDQAYVAVLVPVWAKETGGGAAAIGTLFAVFSGAAIAGAALASAYASRLPRYTTYLVAFLVCGSPRFLVLALESPLWAVLAVAVVSGFGAGFINPVLGAVIFERIPTHLVGRVSALNTALCWSLIPFGGLVGGLLVGGLGMAGAMLACGAAYLAATMLPAVQPQWREMDRRPAAGAA